jgi:carbonic anhydrase/acetyltransferase-like protein (isoleucine patch superfamily)
MAPLLALYDLLYLSLAAALYCGAGLVCVRAFAALSMSMPQPLAAALGVLAALLALIAEVAILAALCPRLVPGRYPLARPGKVAVAWILRSMLRRVLFLPSLKWIYFSSNILRFLSLRALGARVAFTANISSDVDLLDPQLCTIGPGAIVGARCFVTGHLVKDGVLLLREVKIGAGALLALQVTVAPGCSIGEHAVLKPGASLSVGAQIGARAEVGISAFVDTLARVGEGAVIETLAHVPPRERVAAGARFPRATGTASAPASVPTRAIPGLE